MVNATTLSGTIISNQGFVSGDGSSGTAFAPQPSDDPDTSAVNDPTQDVVGDLPVVDVVKTVAIVNDLNDNSAVDPGDTLRYTITSTNLGLAPATDVTLVDDVPAGSTYVANSVLLNGEPVAQPDGGILPLAGAGIAISSSDLTPPLPTAGNGTLSPGESAVVTFDVTVNAVAAGTPISNQAFVSSNEQATEPSDVDGVDSNGDQPTVVTVGNAPQLTITKQVLVVGGGVALAGGQLEYLIRVTNTGTVPASNVVITDNLDLPVAGQMTYDVGSGLLNGSISGVSFAGTTLTADYSSVYGDLPAGSIAELRFTVTLAATLNAGDLVTNTADVSWNVPVSTASASADIVIGQLPPGITSLSGEVWHDADLGNDADENPLAGWRVELYRGSVLLGYVLTDSNGQYEFNNLAPDNYIISYVAPGATATTASLGNARSAYINGPQRISNINAGSGVNITGLNLPLQPNGVIYDSIDRGPLAGAAVQLYRTGFAAPLPTSCFSDPAQQGQVTLAQGFYKFDLVFDPVDCPAGADYTIQVNAPGDYNAGPSVAIPPSTPALDAAACGTAGDNAATAYCEVQGQVTLPTGALPTDYYLDMILSSPTPENSQLFNNHIPVDPDLGEAVAISKVAGIQNVTRSQLVPYTITVNNTFDATLTDIDVVDAFPAGFKYVTGSARVDGAEMEPDVDNNLRTLTWNFPTFNFGAEHTIKLLLVVGSGVSEGEYVNNAWLYDNFTMQSASGVASATVRVIPDPTFDCTDIIGKVFDDRNMNAYQDEGEPGLPGVEVATARGLRVTTDKHGRFHVTCAAVPNEVRGSNFIMKVDDRSLPSGYRITTENPRVQRITRGKMTKFNFGATIHRVVRLDMADGVFEKGSTELRPQWQSRIDMLITELQKEASILRLSYLGENETESEVEDRLDAIEDLISDRWEHIDCCYRLTIEKEVFWRKGKPSDRKGFE
jgi:uncharacterized repeat protein (TIGR01451 family)